MAETEEFTQTISTADFNETPRLTLEQPTGNVEIIAWDRPEIQVSVSDPSRGFELARSGAQVTIINRPGNFKTVNFVSPNSADLDEYGINMEKMASAVERRVERAMRRLGRHIDIGIDLGHWAGGRDYTIKVPHTCDITLRTSSGDIAVSGVSGALLLQSTSGDVRLQEIAGSVLVNTASGDINIRSLDGKLGLRTASGDVNVNRATLREMSAQTASGDLGLQLRNIPERAFDVRTVSGDVRLFLQAEASVSFEIQTLSGEINCEFPRNQVRYTSAHARHTTLELNGGGPRATVATVSGDISIQRNRVEAEAPAPQSATTAAGAAGAPTMDLGRSAQAGEGQADRVEPEGYAERKESQLEILQALERGEISSQEAMRRLSEFED